MCGEPSVNDGGHAHIHLHEQPLDGDDAVQIGARPLPLDEILHIVVSEQDIDLYPAPTRAIDPICLMFQPLNQAPRIGRFPVGAPVVAVIPEQHDPFGPEEPRGAIHDG